jgi:hypothetical protein
MYPKAPKDMREDMQIKCLMIKIIQGGIQEEVQNLTLKKRFVRYKDYFIFLSELIPGNSSH